MSSRRSGCRPLTKGRRTAAAPPRGRTDPLDQLDHISEKATQGLYVGCRVRHVKTGKPDMLAMMSEMPSTRKRKGYKCKLQYDDGSSRCGAAGTRISFPITQT